LRSGKKALARIKKILAKRCSTNMTMKAHPKWYFISGSGTKSVKANIIYPKNIMVN
jgi:hypothetical protein